MSKCAGPGGHGSGYVESLLISLRALFKRQGLRGLMKVRSGEHVVPRTEVTGCVLVDMVNYGIDKIPLPGACLVEEMDIFTLNNFAAAGKCFLVVADKPVLLAVAVFFGSMTAAAALSELGREREGRPTLLGHNNDTRTP